MVRTFSTSVLDSCTSWEEAFDRVKQYIRVREDKGEIDTGEGLEAGWLPERL